MSTEPTKSKYGCRWPAHLTDLEIEFAMIHRGGKFTFKGKEVGKGLFHHYREAQSIMWPDDDHHRWSDLILKTILEERITVIQGSRDSSKTYTVSKYALTDYFAFPDITLILMSSTDIRGLELRVWGTIKDLFSRAKEKFPWLPGNVVDAKHGVFTDSLGEEAEVRDMRRGIIAIPCVSSNGEFQGIAKYCFPAGTMVDTPFGPRPIQAFKEGDAVINAEGVSTILACGSRYAPQLIRLYLSDGRTVDCTPDHPFLTSLGWKKAIDIFPNTHILGYGDILQNVQKSISRETGAGAFLFYGMPTQKLEQAVQGLWDNIHPLRTKSGILQPQLLGDLAMETAGAGGEVFGRSPFVRLHVGSHSQIHHVESEGAKTQERVNEEAPTKAKGWIVKANAKDVPRDRRANSRRDDPVWIIPRSEIQFSSQHREKLELETFCTTLQDRLGVAGYSSSRGNRWSVPQSTGTEKERQSKGCFLKGARLVRSEILRFQGDPRYDERTKSYRVYDLQVKGHPSFSVNGVIAHNCGLKQKRRRLLGDEVQFMQISYLDSLSNLDKGDFKGAFCGNPLGQGDPLDKIAEPEKGWDSIGEITKTSTWRNKFQGATLDLVGIDSPNFDQPGKPKYPYLITPDDVERVAARWGKDSVQYFSQIMGVRKPGLNAHRVLTRELCLKFGAFNDTVWHGKPTTKVYGIDASYGGDRCVGGYCEYGEDVNSVVVLKVHPPVIIPILVKSTEIPEDQIAHFVRADCERNGIPPENVFYDATGRGSLGTSFGRIWSSAVNPIEFGGNPSSRPVSHDTYMFDDRTKERRLKLAHEHYSKFVTELYFSARYTVESGQMRNLPQDVMDEFALREWTMVRGDKIELETKIETKERMGCSPDLADWLVICVEGARRLGFRIERLAAPDGMNKDTFWLSDALAKHKSFVRKTELAYE